MAHWLFKSEPSAWSFEKLAGCGAAAALPDVLLALAACKRREDFSQLACEVYGFGTWRHGP